MRTPFLTLVAALVFAVPAAAQRAHIGAHAGYQFDANEALVGGQMTLPASRFVELYPSLDVYLVDTGSLLAFNGDLKLRLTPGAPLQLYAGGGINVLRRRGSGGGSATTDTGFDLLAGVESRRGGVHPYVEGRWLVHDATAFQLNGGLNITLF